MAFWIVLVVLAGAVAAAVQLYNALVRLRNGSESAWSDIEVQLKRRSDLVPNLVETVKGYAAHEAGTLEHVTQARSAALGARDVGERAAAESALGRALGSLLAVAEAYPELEADQTFLELQRELSELEQAIQGARRYYNAVVRDLNTRCEAFPSNLVARQFGFAKRSYFELDSPEDRKPPSVRFGS